MNVGSQFSILSELKNPAALEPHMRMSEAFRDNNIHRLASILLIVCKLMPGIMQGILGIISMGNYNISKLLT